MSINCENCGICGAPFVLGQNHVCTSHSEYMAEIKRLNEIADSWKEAAYKWHRLLEGVFDGNDKVTEEALNSLNNGMSNKKEGV